MILERKETRDEVVQRMHLARARENDRLHHVRWSVMRAFLRACESHFLPKLAQPKVVVRLGFSEVRYAGDGPSSAPLLDHVAELLLEPLVGGGRLTVATRRRTATKIRASVRARRGSTGVGDAGWATRATIQRKFGTARADETASGERFEAGAPRLRSPPKDGRPKVVSKDRFNAACRKHSLNFPPSMADQFFETWSEKNGVDLTRLLCALRLLIDASGMESGVEAVESKLDGLFEIFERHSGRVDRLEQVFAVASKSWEERKAIHDLLDHQFFPAVPAAGAGIVSRAIPISAVFEKSYFSRRRLHGRSTS